MIIFEKYKNGEIFMKFKLIILLIVSLIVVTCGTQKEDQKENIDPNAIENLQNNDTYLQIGNKLVQEISVYMLNEQTRIIDSAGADAAIDYCITNALPIIKKYETENNVTIKRTSKLIRNQINKPNEIENEVLRIFEQKISSNEKTEPVIMKMNDEYHYYNYIFMKKVCLNCHGKLNKELKETTYNKIKNSYPSDQAINYKEDDLRGIWHIVFKK